MPREHDHIYSEHASDPLGRILVENRSLKVGRIIALLKTALEVPKRKEPKEIPIETYSWVTFLSLRTYREEEDHKRYCETELYFWRTCVGAAIDTFCLGDILKSSCIT
jgi:hypothetical protein